MTKGQVIYLIQNHNGKFLIKLEGDQFTGLIYVSKQELLDCISDSEDGSFYAEIFDDTLQLWAYSEYREYQKAEQS